MEYENLDEVNENEIAFPIFHRELIISSVIARPSSKNQIQMEKIIKSSKDSLQSAVQDSLVLASENQYKNGDISQRYKVILYFR